MWFIYFSLACSSTTGILKVVAYFLGSTTAADGLEWVAIEMLICICTLEIVREIREIKR